MQSPGEPGTQQPQGSHADERYAQVRELADLLRPLSRKYLYTLVNDEVIPAVRAGRRVLLYRAFYDAIKAEIDACRPVDVAEFSRQWKAQAGQPPVPVPAGAVS